MKRRFEELVARVISRGRARLVRYIAIELMIPLVVTILLTVLVAGVSQLIKMANEVAGLPISVWDLLSALPYAMPTFLGMGLPVAFLLSMLIAFGRMSEDRELMAMAAAGMSTRLLLAIPLSIGAVLSLLGMYLTVFAEPVAVHKLRSKLVDAAAQYFATSLEPGVIHDDLPDIMIYMGSRDPDSGEMKDVVLADDHDRSKPFLVTAKAGQIRQTVGSHLRFALRDGEVQIGSGKDVSFKRVLFDTLDYDVDTAVFARRAAGQVPLTAETPFIDLWTRSHDPKQPLAERMRDTVALHRKFAFPLANFLFVLVVFPVTTALSRPSRLRAYVLAGLMAGLFFVLAQATDTWINRLSFSPVLAVYAPNIALLVLGLGLSYWRLQE